MTLIMTDWMIMYVTDVFCELVLECYILTQECRTSSNPRIHNAIDVSTWKNKDRDMTYRTKMIQGMYHFSLFFYEKNQTSWRSPNSEGISESGMFSCWSMIFIIITSSFDSWVHLSGWYESNSCNKIHV